MHNSLTVARSGTSAAYVCETSLWGQSGLRIRPLADLTLSNSIHGKVSARRLTHESWIVIIMGVRCNYAEPGEFVPFVVEGLLLARLI